MEGPIQDFKDEWQTVVADRKYKSEKGDLLRSGKEDEWRVELRGFILNSRGVS